jgi:acyl-CoA thioester hydrolase
LGEMQSLHRASVAEDEIDELGHFSAPYYDQRAYLASAALVADLGFSTGVLETQRLELMVVDAFRRNYVEQFQDADLEVTGGIISTSENCLLLYHELHNVVSGDLSATFLHELVLRDLATSQYRAWPDHVVSAAKERLVSWPDRGKGRSLDLTQKPSQPDLTQLQGLGLAISKPRTIRPDECGADGRLKLEIYQELPYTSEKPDGAGVNWVVEGADGKRLGQADLETRYIYYGVPRAGDAVQVFSAVMSLERKTYCRYFWVFDIGSQQLLAVVAVVVVMLDLEARRATEIPPSLRQDLEQHQHPELVLPS